VKSENEIQTKESDQAKLESLKINLKTKARCETKLKYCLVQTLNLKISTAFIY